jgi:hypothetical protein
MPSNTDLPVVQLPDVRISVCPHDHTLLQCLINRTANRGSIAEQINKALALFSPYRDIDPLVLRGVQIYVNGGKSFAAVSRELCGNSSLARRIRYWYQETFGSVDVSRGRQCLD